jgi:8-oxo-dGTP diphosphatase
MGNIDERASVGYYNSRPGIHAGGGVLIFNDHGDLLLVKPSYRNTWAWPGGGWEPGESPLDVAIRECQEEIGVCPSPLYPAFVNYIPPRADGSDDILHFVFTTDPVDGSFMDQVTVRQSEIDSVHFAPAADLRNYMKEYRVRAVLTYLDHRTGNAMLYLEDGRIHSSIPAKQAS